MGSVEHDGARSPFARLSFVAKGESVVTFSANLRFSQRVSQSVWRTTISECFDSRGSFSIGGISRCHTAGSAANCLQRTWKTHVERLLCGTLSAVEVR